MAGVEGAPDEPRSGFSRSRFLKAGAIAAASVGAGPLTQAASGTTGAKDRLNYLRLATYEPLVGQEFKINHPHGPLHARLVEVTNMGSRGSRERASRESFSLLFETRRDEPMPQGTYQLEHRQIGPFSLFLVPIGRGVKGFFVEAAINRWLEATHP